MLFAVVCTAVAVTSQAPSAPERARLLALHGEAVALLKEAARADAPSDPGSTGACRRRTPARSAGRRSGRERPGRRRIAPARAGGAGRAATGARELAAAAQAGAGARFDTGPVLALLERVRAQLEGEVALGLTFQGNYSQTTAQEPVSGGHASGMGPPPGPPPADDDAPSPVSFEEGPRLPARSCCGGPTKDHILESGGSGVALVDYDGDGLVDVYLVTAAELGPGRERIPHRNALYRNLGEWRFEDVSKRAGVDAAAWGNGVCAGDVDNDGHLDLYVTNWGSNLLFRNRGDGAFEEIAGQAGVAAGGWSTGWPFFDADADGDLDLYVARYVETTWDSVVRAQRTLLWRATHHGGAGRPCQVSPISSSRTSGTDASATPPTHGDSPTAGCLRLRRPRNRLRRRRSGRSVRGERLESELPVPQPGQRPVRERACSRGSR